MPAALQVARRQALVARDSGSLGRGENAAWGRNGRGGTAGGRGGRDGVLLLNGACAERTSESESWAAGSVAPITTSFLGLAGRSLTACIAGID